MRTDYMAAAVYESSTFEGAVEAMLGGEYGPNVAVAVTLAGDLLSQRGTARVARNDRVHSSARLRQAAAKQDLTLHFIGPHTFSEGVGDLVRDLALDRLQTLGGAGFREVAHRSADAHRAQVGWLACDLPFWLVADESLAADLSVLFGALALPAVRIGHPPAASARTAYGTVPAVRSDQQGAGAGMTGQPATVRRLSFNSLPAEPIAGSLRSLLAVTLGCPLPAVQLARGGVTCRDSFGRSSLASLALGGAPAAPSLMVSRFDLNTRHVQQLLLVRDGGGQIAVISISPRNHRGHTLVRAVAVPDTGDSRRRLEPWLRRTVVAAAVDRLACGVRNLAQRDTLTPELVVACLARVPGLQSQLAAFGRQLDIAKGAQSSLTRALRANAPIPAEPQLLPQSAPRVHRVVDTPLDRKVKDRLLACLDAGVVHRLGVYVTRATSLSLAWRDPEIVVTRDVQSNVVIASLRSGESGWSLVLSPGKCVRFDRLPTFHGAYFVAHSLGIEQVTNAIDLMQSLRQHFPSTGPALLDEIEHSLQRRGEALLAAGVRAYLNPDDGSRNSEKHRRGPETSLRARSALRPSF